MDENYTRRAMLQLAGQASLAGLLGTRFCVGAETGSFPASPFGVVVGQTTGAEVGNEVLANGGNAVDAAVAAALAACVASPNNCGIGGYGGHMTLALAGGRKVTSIDFNTMAPAAAHADMYPLDDKGEGKGRVNFYGWLASDVPGTIAGL